MIIKKSVNLVEVLIDEVSLEGLDGITLEALWQRLAIRLEETLPLKDSFMEQIWKICLDIDDFHMYELENPRDKLVIYDLYDLEYMNLDDSTKHDEPKDIYPHCPIEDLKNSVRGSCSTYSTRKKISDEVKNCTLLEVIDKYGQKLVIVASQILREKALIDDCATLITPLSILHYCILERIGRSRKIGEITIKKNHNIKEDARSLFYIREGLRDLGLIRKQVYYQGNHGQFYKGQNTGTLIHLPRFFNLRQPKVIEWAKKLINFLKSKDNCAADYTEVKNELNLDYSVKKFFKIQLLQKVFKTDLKVPYRSYYTNCDENEWRIKNHPSRERIIKLVTLVDPNLEISDIWRNEEVQEDEKHFQLDIRQQKFNVPFLKQIYDVVESKESKGASQSELGLEMGFTKLISRSLTRNLVKSKIVSTYLDDIGRQRVTKFVSRKFEDKSNIKKQFELEVSKIKEHSQSIKTINKNANKKKIKKSICNEEKNTQAELLNQVETISTMEKNIPSDKEIENLDNLRYHKFQKVNSIIKKYKIFKNKNRYQLTRIRKDKKLTVKNSRKKVNNNFSNKLDSKNIESTDEVILSEFYKAIDAKLVVQKPECKKKSQKFPIVGFMENVKNPDSFQTSNISYKLLRRANLIIEKVKEEKIIEDTQKLVKFINEEEKKEGYGVAIDKNSLLRLLQKLVEDNFIKCIKLILKNKNQTKQKIVNFICDPSIDENHTVIQSAVEQAKLKFCLMENNLASIIGKEDKALKSANCYKKKALLSKHLAVDYKQGKKYGYQPKFVRMKVMHIFLYYLIYGHPKKLIPEDVFLEQLKSYGISYDDVFDSGMNVYNSEISWKMFITPLPFHQGYESGWAYMSDVLLRLPLSLFVQMHNLNYEVPGLQKFLDHPIKRHFLVKDIPAHIRNMVLLKRRYLFSMHELVCRLSFIGLVQFGPQVMKEKDQFFFYLNRRSELMDTTSSAAHYHIIEDKPYPVTKYEFTSLAVVENYWYELWNTCINTCLGGRTVVEGKDILLEDLSRKPEMIQAMKIKAPNEVVAYDTGYVPGDRKGAAGIDSAFFPHLKRNWNWVAHSNHADFVKKKVPIVKALKTTKVIPNSSNEHASKVNQLKKRVSFQKQNQTKVAVASKEKSLQAAKPQLQINRGEKGQISVNVSVVPGGRPIKTIRKVMPRKRMIRRRVKYDEIDYSALQRMDKLRVDWEQHEDNILLVCKVAMIYLAPNSRNNPISFIAIRDILRAYSFTSHNKTSRACQRRLLYMLKQPKTLNSVMLGVEEVKQDHYVNKRFGALVEKIRRENKAQIDYESKIEEVFKDLVAYIAKKYYNISDMECREPVILPQTIQEFNMFYKLKLPSKTIVSPGVSKEVREVNDIHTATINSVIHSSMCCGKERRSWAYQLFKVYQQYPEYLLRSAMLKIRADQMVTMKKSYMNAYKTFGNCLPMSSSQYQLSSAYYYKFQLRWPYEIFSESYNILFSLLEEYAQRGTAEIEITPGDSGLVAVMHDFVGTNTLKVDTEIPDQIIMLDPTLPEKDEVYQRIASRYKSILEGLSSTDFAVDKNVVNGVSESDEKALDLDLEIAEDNQQTFDEIRSVKRPLEEDSSLQLSKRPKLDSTENNSIEKDLNKDEAMKMTETQSARFNHSKQNDCKLDRNESLTDENKFNSGSFKSINSFNIDANNFDDEIVDLDEDVDMRIDESPANNLSDINSDTGRPQVKVENSNSSIQTPLQNLDSKTATSVISKSGFTRTSELVKRMGNCEWMNNVVSRVEVSDVRTRQTRIAMLKMREELHDLTFHDSHHAHEYFVVNSFKLFTSLSVSDEDKDDTIMYQNMKIPKKLLSIDVETTNKVLDDIKQFATFPRTSVSYEEFKKETIKSGLFEWNHVHEICKFIRSRAEHGATLHELVTNFEYLNDKLADILNLLFEQRIVLRAGITAVRYIYNRYVNPWIIQSYKILRLDKESHENLPEGSVYVLDNEESNADEKEAKRITTAANLFYDPPIKQCMIESQSKEIKSSSKKIVKNSKDDKIDTQANLQMPSTSKDSDIVLINECDKTMNDKERSETEVTKDVQTNSINIGIENNADFDVDEEPTNQRRLRRNKTILLKQKEIYRAAKLLDFNTAEEIRVIIKPWIRIDGVLNRRVLDRMLGAVLCYCIEKPGISLTAVQNRFTPAIQPYHTRELIEILEKLQCIKMSVQRVVKSTLFSKPAKLDLSGNPNLVADSDLIVIEPTMQANLKFGIFLSNRSYNLDFLSSL